MEHDEQQQLTNLSFAANRLLEHVGSASLDTRVSVEKSVVNICNRIDSLLFPQAPTDLPDNRCLP